MYSQIEVIRFLNSDGTTVKTFAAPFNIKEGANVDFTVSGNVLTITGTSAGVTSLSGLDDVTIVTPTESQILTYNAVTGKWENRNQTDIALETIGSLALHLRSDLGITKDGSDLVSVWEDQSGQGNHFLQAVGATQPTWVDSVINGNPALLFSGAQWMHCSTFDAIGGGLNKPFTAFFVFSRTNWLLASQLVLHSYFLDGSSRASAISFLTLNNVLCTSNQAIDNGPTVMSPGFRFDTGVTPFGRNFVQYTAYTSPNGFRLSNRVDGSPLGLYSNWLSASSSVAVDVKYACLGARNLSNTFASPSLFLRGHVAEIIIFDEALPLASIQMVEQYLAKRYMIGGEVVNVRADRYPNRYISASGSSYTAQDFDQEVRATGSNTTITIPNVANSTPHRQLTVTRFTANAGATTINPSSVKINGNNAAQALLKENYQSVTLALDGAEWVIVGSSPETANTLGTLTNSLTEKTTPVDADMVPVMDSAASNIWKKLSWTNIKATLKAYFDTLYSPILSYGHMYNNNNDTTVTIDTVDVPVEITAGFTGGLTSGFTFGNGHQLTCNRAGTYLIVYSISGLTASVANKTFEGGVMVNGVVQAGSTSHAEVSPGGSSRPEVMSGNLIVTLAANDQVSLFVLNHDDTTDLVVVHSNMSILGRP